MVEKLLAPAARGLGRVDMIVEEIESLLPRPEAGADKDLITEQLYYTRSFAGHDPSMRCARM